ncbi:MAG: caspase family protein [Myxococcales bacterium]|nr:caspase family protein [Myxococcales bacterium]
MTALLWALATWTADAGPAHRSRGLTPARSTSEALNAALQPRRVALLVGVDRYDDPAFPALRHAGHDADLLAGVFRDPATGGFDDVRLLTGAPTRSDVLSTLRSLTQNLRREDVLVVYVSSHGTRVQDGSRMRRYLLQRDSRAADLETTAVELEALQSWFSSLAPARKALVVDACFNGDGKSVVRPSSRSEPVPETFGPSATAMGAGEAHLFATSPGRPALEDDQLGHGVYSYFLIEALSWSFEQADRDRDGVVTAWEAHDHARGRTLERTSGAQVPEAAFRVVGTADLVLAGRPRDRKRRDRALVYLYPPPSHPLSGATLSVDGRPRGRLPGTVAVEPGRHHLSLVDAQGTLLAQGHLTLAQGRPYRAEDLTRLLRGPSLGFGVRPVFATEPAMRTAVGATTGLELHTYLRDDQAPGFGMFGGLSLAVANGTRAVGGQPDARQQLTLSLDVGTQHDWRRLRGRLSLSVSGVWLPPDHAGERPDEPVRAFDIPDRAGWIYVMAGPSAGLGWVVNETWSVGLQARVAGTWLDLDGDGRASAVWRGSVALGPEIVLH